MEYHTALHGPPSKKNLPRGDCMAVSNEPSEGTIQYYERLANGSLCDGCMWIDFDFRAFR